MTDSSQRSLRLLPIRRPNLLYRKEKPCHAFGPLDEAIMTRPTSDDNSVLLVHAYLDGELDPANALGITQQMDTVPALAAEAERVKALQRLFVNGCRTRRRRLGCVHASRRRSAA